MFVMRTQLVLNISNKMAGRPEHMRSSCFESTKYTCLKCTNYFCMRCSVFESDEDVAEWKAGSSVAYCGSCFEFKMTTEMNHENVDREEDFQKQTSGRKIQEAGQSAKPDSPKRYAFKVSL